MLSNKIFNIECVNLSNRIQEIDVDLQLFKDELLKELNSVSARFIHSKIESNKNRSLKQFENIKNKARILEKLSSGEYYLSDLIDGNEGFIQRVKTHISMTTLRKTLENTPDL